MQIFSSFSVLFYFPKKAFCSYFVVPLQVIFFFISIHENITYAYVHNIFYFAAAVTVAPTCIEYCGSKHCIVYDKVFDCSLISAYRLYVSLGYNRVSLGLKLPLSPRATCVIYTQNNNFMLPSGRGSSPYRIWCSVYWRCAWKWGRLGSHGILMRMEIRSAMGWEWEWSAWEWELRRRSGENPCRDTAKTQTLFSFGVRAVLFYSLMLWFFLFEQFKCL